MRHVFFHPHPWGPALRSVASAWALLGLAACGGGGGSAGTPLIDTPNISAVTPDRVSYGRSSSFSVTGTNLLNLSFAATGCSGLTQQAGGTQTSQTLTCTPTAALSVRLSASTGSGEIYNNTWVVPTPQVTLTTTLGNIVVDLDPVKAPLTVDNFLAYVNAGFYTDTLMHRVVRGFVSQGGGFTAVAGNTLTAKAGARPPIALETNKGLSNVRGSIAMARTDAFDSATSQFFFNQVNNDATSLNNLDYQNAANPGYAVFGAISSGLAVIDAMNVVATRTVGGFTNVPVTNIVVQTAVQTR